MGRARAQIFPRWEISENEGGECWKRRGREGGNFVKIGQEGRRGLGRGKLGKRGGKGEKMRGREE